MNDEQRVLRDEEMERYSRHLLLESVGVRGQERLLNSSVLVIGAGGLGSPAAIYLAAAGVGRIGIVDGDTIELSNLQRQILFRADEVGGSKAQKVADRLRDLNACVQVDVYEEYLTPDNAERLLQPYDVVLNGSDNFATRYLVNDACVRLGKPLVDASVVMFEGQAAVYLPGRGCYRCLYPEPPAGPDAPTCSTAGVLGALVGHMGTLQALETLKICLGVGETLGSRLLFYDAMAGSYAMLRRERDPNCPVCGDAPRDVSGDYQAFCLPTVQEEREQRKHPAGSEASSSAEDAVLEITVDELQALLAAGGVQLIDLRDEQSFARGHIAGARSLPYDEFVAALPAWDRRVRTALICYAGRTSRLAWQRLQAQGCSDVWSVRGGMIEWERQRLPIQQQET